MGDLLGLRFSWCLLLLCLIPTLHLGCGRSLLSFEVAAGSLIRPVLDLEVLHGENGNLRRIFNRIRWMEQLREWEVRLQAHALSDWLGKAPSGRLKQCGASCSRCFSGNVSLGEVAMPCWTQQNGASYDELLDSQVLNLQLQRSGLSGILKLEVPTLSQAGGEGFVTWEKICFPAIRQVDAKVDGICVSGLTGYRVKLDNEVNPTRQDTLWVVRMNVSEGIGQNALLRRVDGVMGVLFKQREQVVGQELTRRKAVLIDEKNALYQNFKTTFCKANSALPGYRDCCGSVNVLAADGEYFCSFVGFGVPAVRRKSCWPASLVSTPSLLVSTFELRCQKK